MSEVITYITSNPAKAEQLSWHTDLEVTHRKIDLPEIQSLDLAEVVSDKARRAYEIVGSPVLVEDTSLAFNALGKLPGPLVKWFLQELGNAGLCGMLDGYGDRSAHASLMIGYFDGNTLQTFSGSRDGVIAEKPRGVSSYGWDPVFIPEGYSKTWGEMDRDEQMATSMRRLAIQKLEAALKA